MDMGFSGRWFTWERGNLPETNIQERLDRGVANQDWVARFPDISIQHLTHSISDHCPLLVNTEKIDIKAREIAFRFEAWWTMDESFEEEVKNIWELSSGNLLVKLNELKTGLRIWASRIQADRKKRKAFLTDRLADFLDAERDYNNLAELIDTKVQLNLEIDKDERYWEQRARINWLKYGNRNTAFFHCQATQQRRRNTIHKMQDESGRETEISQNIAYIARAYFQRLFRSEERGRSEHLLSGIANCITEEDNHQLMKPFTKEEIRSATFEMGSTKAPEEDGLPALFYQKCWHIVGDAVSKFCLQNLNEGKEFKQVNATNIVFIPKVANPVNMKQFRPISLSNILYKIMAKAIANRLRGVIGKCIDMAQSAFVPGRLISDNVMLAYELFHTLKQKRTGRKGFMAVKLDMSKAYDRVEWNFVEDIMIRMGFASNWVETIMKCLNSVRYSVIVNGCRGDVFHPKRGLRQGDPLSPFIFLLCGEGLSSLMRLAMQEGLLRGVKASRSGPQVSHLLFADDCILFSEASERGATILKEILRKYRRCSGQCVNFDKSTAFFSKNTSDSDRNLVGRILGVRCSTDPERYLGLPNMVGRKKKESFQVLKD